MHGVWDRDTIEIHVSLKRVDDPHVTFEERLDPALLEAYAASPEIDLGRNIPKLRFLIERYEAPLRAALPPIPEVTVTDHLVPGSNGNPDVRVRTYEPEGRAAGSAAIFWIHGGGMVIGTIDGDDFMCKTWARDFGCLVASVDYRLAPEHQYPAHIDDCYTGLQWFHTRLDDYRVDRSRLVIGGASAGGGLAAGTALLARDRRRGAALLPVPRLPDDRRPRRDRIDARDHDHEGMEPAARTRSDGGRTSAIGSAAATCRSTPHRHARDGRRPAGPAPDVHRRRRARPVPRRGHCLRLTAARRRACRASCTSRQVRSTDRRWRFPTRRAHGASAPTGATLSAACSPDGTSSRPSAWRAKRPASRGCTGSSVGHGQPPKPVRR